jgi:drug/metabolite transporter (DMT)-like permease
MTHKNNNNLVGIGFMVSGMFALVLMDAVAKWLVEANISPVQVLAIRSWIIVSVILLVLLVRRDFNALKTRRPIAHGIRGALGFAAPLCFFLALKRLPLADATVVFYASTFILTAMSALVFKERVGIHRWGAVVTGFAGVVIAVDPAGDGEISAYLLVLCSAFVYSLLLLTGKRLTEQDSITSLVFSFNLMIGVVSTLLLPLVWIPVSLTIVSILLLLAVLALCGHYLLTIAFSKAQISAVAPFEYTSLVWATLVGYLFWLDIPSLRVWVGAAIIIASGLYVIHRESRYLRVK